LKSVIEEDKNELIRQLVDLPKYKSGKRKRRELSKKIKNEIIKCLKENEMKRNDGRRKLQMKNIYHEYLDEKEFNIGDTTILSNYSQKVYTVLFISLIIIVNNKLVYNYH